MCFLYQETPTFLQNIHNGASMGILVSFVKVKYLSWKRRLQHSSSRMLTQQSLNSLTALQGFWIIWYGKFSNIATFCLHFQMICQMQYSDLLN